MVPISSRDWIIPSLHRSPTARSKSSPGVLMVTVTLSPFTRISSGSSITTSSSTRRGCCSSIFRTDTRLESRIASLSFDPDFSVLEEFLLPNRNHFLELVDGVVAGIEGGAPMCGGDDDRDAGFSDVEAAEPMNHRNTVDIPGLTDKDAD